MPMLRDRKADRLFEIDIVGWHFPDASSFYEAQLLRCRLGLTGGGLDINFIAPALYRWELDIFTAGLEKWLTGVAPRVAFQFFEREFELDLTAGETHHVMTAAIREGIEGTLLLNLQRGDIQGFATGLISQAENFPPRGKEWSDLFAKHYQPT